MKSKIIADSCCDLNPEIKKNVDIELVPLTMRIDDVEYVDDDSFNQADYIKAMKKSKHAPKTSCPSVNDFLERLKEAKDTYIVTLSSKLSGTYNSAMQAKKMIQEEFSNRFIHVFDSKSASVGETLISLKINEFISQNLEKLEIVERVNEYINEMKTFFVLESMDNLAKAGRLNPLIAKAASILSIKPILGEENGKIRLVDKVRGHDRALRRMLDIIGDEGKKLEEKILGIAHCNCLQRALDFKDKVLKKYRFKDVIIVDTAGISTTYANDGGLIIAF